MPRSRDRRRRIVVLAAAVVAGLTGLLAQTPTAPPPAQPQAPEMPTPRFRAEADVVVVEATVLDRKGAIVRDLGPADFKVEIGGKPRDIVSVRSRRVRAPVVRRLDRRHRPRDHDERAPRERPHRPADHRPGQPGQRCPRGDRLGAEVGALDAPQGPDRPADVSRAGAERRLHRRPRQGRRGADACGRRRPAVAALPAIQHQRLGGDPHGRAGHVRPQRRHRTRMPGQPAAVSDRSRAADQDDGAGRAVADPARHPLAAGDDAGPGQDTRAEARGAALVRLGDERARRGDRDGLGRGRRGPRQRHHPHLHRGDVGTGRVALAALDAIDRGPDAAHEQRRDAGEP